MNNLGIYIHIPFCVRKCGYCDFYSLEGCDSKKDQYADALYDYLECYAMQAANKDVDSVYFGGGTPTCLDPSVLAKLIKAVKRDFRVTKNCEITMEANPGTVSCSDLRKLVSAGLTRLSVGAQSIHDKELTGLTRIYNSNQLFDALDAAQKARVPEISVDIMYGIPHQTVRSLIETIDRLCSYKNVNHVSLYGLMIEEGTNFYKYRDILPLPDEDTERKMYFEAAEHLEFLGYKQYEISNFAKAGHECRHNIKYWNCEEYLGIGPGAHSYFAGKRFSYKKDIDLFMGLRANEDPIDECMEIMQKDRIGEYVMLKFRMNDGIDAEVFFRKFGVDFDKMYFNRLSPYIYRGLVVHDGNSYKFTREGMYVSNHILSDIIDF